MKKVTLMFLTLILVSAFYSQINAQILLDENFDYTTGTLLTTKGWTNHSGSGNFLKVVDGNLTFTNYPLSNKGGMVTLVGQSASSEDVNRPFIQQTTGTLYTSFLVKVDTSSLGDYFFHYKYNGGSSIFLARTYVKGNGDGTFKFGLSKAKTDTIYSTQSYKYGTTYLVVVKYQYTNDALGKDDTVSLYVNPSLTAEPATPDVKAYDASTGTGVSDSPLDAIALRQGSDVYKATVDGIRVANTWSALKLGLTIPVTIQVDMSVQIAKGQFTVGKDTVVARGSFQKDAGDTVDWNGYNFRMSDPDTNKIYTVTAYLPADSAGKKYEYKFVKSGVWESAANKTFTLTAPGPQVLPVVFYNNEKPAAKTYHITFIADISKIVGSGEGYFDPSSPRNDSLLVMGLDWEGGTVLAGERKMHKAGLQAGVYTTTMTVQATGDSTKWKFHAYPENHFSNSGWETGDDNWFVYGKDTVVTIGPRVPRITPSAPALTAPVKVLFQVNMNNAKNAYDNSPIPKADISFVGVKGADSTIGAWAGSWVVADTGTTPKTFIVFNDSGKDGDKVAGDNIWSKLVTFKTGTPGGTVEFKFGCWYKDADKHTQATAVLDNEAGFGKNHAFVLKNSTTVIELMNNFGEMTTDVKEVKTNSLPTRYELVQNFPNPFNPATTIRYSVPQAGMVTLKIYNTLGQEVATLVNTIQNAGTYDVSFDASRLSSGIYLYNITSGSFSQTKKMMLVK